MKQELKNALLKHETDLEGALDRLSGDEQLYMDFLDSFLKDQTISDLDSALKTRSWDEAFTAAHALKGLAGNMGFVPLFQTTAELVINIRAGKLDDANATFTTLKRCYIDITNVIRYYCDL